MGARGPVAPSLFSSLAVIVKRYNYKERLLLDQLMVTESGEKS